MGPVGCGKTTAIQVLAAASRQMGHFIQQQVISTRAIESDFLFGHWDGTNRYSRILLFDWKYYDAILTLEL